MSLLEKVKSYFTIFKFEIESCNDKKSLQELQIRYVGRKSGIITDLFKSLGSASNIERAEIGKILNELKNFVVKEIENKRSKFENSAKAEPVHDLTLPGRRQFLGSKHLLTIVMEEMSEILQGMGFEIATGPDIETDYYNFEALNIPPDHPARALQDTFYLEEDKLLRTHTSPVQIRVMEKQKPPIRIIAPGRVYRKDSPDATHSPVFHQVEGLYVDKGVTLAELKGTLLAFAKAMFGEHMNIRFRSGFFPFTEPSVEYDFTCVICSGNGCKFCKNTGWVEISGSGMVDPEVFKHVGIDPEIYTGFAWGMGLERIALLKYHVHDIRVLYENDQRFLNQFYL